MEKQNPQNVVDRYTSKSLFFSEPNNASNLKARFSEYSNKRKDSGYPVLFIYDCSEQVKHGVNERIPSEVEIEAPLKPEELKLLFVPKKYLESINEEYGNLLSTCGATVMPIEVFEEHDD